MVGSWRSVDGVGVWIVRGRAEKFWQEVSTTPPLCHSPGFLHRTSTLRLMQ